MGLDISHDAFHGAYGKFDRFRTAICKAMGGSWPEQHGGIWYWGDGYDKDTHPGLYALLMHSDCEGKIHYATAGKLADELEALLPKFDEGDDMNPVCEQFIKGCRTASKARQYLDFH